MFKMLALHISEISLCLSEVPVETEENKKTSDYSAPGRVPSVKLNNETLQELKIPFSSCLWIKHTILN
jgi:hypothetical protein